MSVVIADHLGIEGRGGEAVGQLCIAGGVGLLLHVDVGGSDDQQGWGSLEHTHTSSDRKWAHSASKCTNLQFLDVWDPEVHQVFLLAFLVMAVAELRGARIHLLLAGQVLHAHTRHTAHTPGTQLTHQAHSSHTRHTAHTPGTQLTHHGSQEVRHVQSGRQECLTGNSGIPGVTILAVMFSISVDARQPLSSSTVTTRTLVCSASKCRRAASSPSLAATTTERGTPTGRSTHSLHMHWQWLIGLPKSCSLCAILHISILSAVGSDDSSLREMGSARVRASPKLFLISGFCQPTAPGKHLAPRRLTPARQSRHSHRLRALLPQHHACC